MPSASYLTLLACEVLTCLKKRNTWSTATSAVWAETNHVQYGHGFRMKPPIFCSCLTKVPISETNWWHLPTFGWWEIHSPVLRLSNCKNWKVHGSTAIGKVTFFFLKKNHHKNRSVTGFWRTTAKAFEHCRAQCPYFKMRYGCVSPSPATAPQWAQGHSSTFRAEARDAATSAVCSVISYTHNPALSAACRNHHKGKEQ